MEEETKQTTENNDVLADIKVIEQASLLDSESEDDAILRNPAASKKGRLLICKQCNKLFSTSYKLNQHMREMHGLFVGGNRNYSTFTCSLCEKKSISKVSYERHLLTVHEITIEKERITFCSVKEFRIWKEDMEKDTSCLFTKNTGSHKVNGMKLSYYYCYQNGNSRDVADFKRHRELQIMGSSKLNKTCPAMIKVRELKDLLVIDFVKTHVGHSIDSFGISKLSDEEKNGIANKLVNESVATSELDEFQESGVNGLEKVHLITRDEISFIRSEFKVFIENQNPDAEDSINTWVSDMQDDENSSIIFFKPQNVSSDIFSGLNESDFMLIIMNKSQKEMLTVCGNNVMCIDFEQNTSNYRYFLTSLLVLDSNKRAFPGAFIISNRHDSISLTIAFDSIKEQGVDIHPKIFLSNNHTCFLDAWDFVFGLPKKYSLCSWDADNVWRNKLNKMVPKSDHARVHKMLYSLLVEADVEAFKMSLSTSVKNLIENPLTETFGEYFKKKFATHPEKWAYCYRDWSEIDTSVHMERMHETLKYIFLEGKSIRRIDKTVYFLFKFLKDKAFENLISKEKIAAKKLEIALCHGRSLSLPINVLCRSKKEWLIASQSKTGKAYFLSEREPCTSDCELICEPCGFCCHRFSCSCDNFVFKKNMCKHIHLLCRMFNSAAKSPSRELNSISIAGAHSTSIADAHSTSITDAPKSILDCSSSALNSHAAVTNKEIHCADVGLQVGMNGASKESCGDWEEVINLDGLDKSPRSSESLDEVKNSVLDLYGDIGKNIEDCTSLSDYRALRDVMEIGLKSFKNYKNTKKRKSRSHASQNKCTFKRGKL